MALLPILLLFVVFYVLMIRPQQRRAREHQALIASVRVGDEVMTTAGIFGTVTALEDTAVSLEIAPGVVVRVARAALGQRLGPEPIEDDEPPADDEPIETNAVEAPAAEENGGGEAPESKPESGHESPWGDWGQPRPEGT